MTSSALYLTSKGERIPTSVMVGFVGGLALVVIGGLQSMGLFSAKPAQTATLDDEDDLEKKKERKERKRRKKAEAEAAAEAAREAEKAAKKATKLAEQKEKKAARKEEQKKLEEEAAAVKEETKTDKKKKKKKKKKAGESVATEAVVEVVEKERDDGEWIVQPSKKEIYALKKAKGSSSGPVITSEMMVNPRHYPTIMGAGAINLARIQEELGVQVRLPRRGGSDEKIRFTGCESDIETAKEVVYELMDKGYSKILDSNQTDKQLEVSNLGLLIGPSGANIRQIQAKTGTRIQLPEKGGKDSNSVTIYGDIEAVRKATAAINQLMEDGYCDLTHDDYTKSTLSFPSSMTGVLLGPKGSNIRRIQEQTGTRINVPDLKGDEKPFVEIKILGPAAKVEEALRIITAVQTDYTSREFDFPEELLPSLIGSQAANIKRIQKETNTRVDVSAHLWDPSQKCVTVSGFSKDIASVERELALVIANNTKWVGDFPAERIGVMFGKGGEGIRKLQQSTGTRISVQEHEWDDMVKEITVVGPAAGVEQVKAEVERLSQPPARKEPKTTENTEPAAEE